MRLAGLPPVLRVAAGMLARTMLTSSPVRSSGRRGTLRDDRPGDARREPLLAVHPQDPRELALVVGVEHVRRGLAGRGVHAHVERRVGRVGEAALALVELQRRDAEVHEHALDARDAQPVEHVVDLVVDGVHAGEAVTERRQPSAGELERLRVAVQADDPDVRERLQDALGVAAHAERRVHHHGVLDVERRGQQVEAALQQHRGVPGGRVVGRARSSLLPSPGGTDACGQAAPPPSDQIPHRPSDTGEVRQRFGRRSYRAADARGA